MGLTEKQKSWIITMAFMVFLSLLALFFLFAENTHEKEKLERLKKDSVAFSQKIQIFSDSLRIQKDTLVQLQHDLRAERQKNQYLKKDIDTLKKVVFILSEKYNLSQKEIAEMKKKEQKKGFWEYLSHAWEALWK